MNKWLLLLKALRKGAVLSNPAKWKTQQIVVTALVGAGVLLYQAATAFGWVPPAWLGQADVVQIATAVGTLLFVAHNITATVVSSDKVGIGKGGPDKPPPGPVDGVLDSTSDVPSEAESPVAGYWNDPDRGPFDKGH